MCMTNCLQPIKSQTKLFMQIKMNSGNEQVEIMDLPTSDEWRVLELDQLWITD